MKKKILAILICAALALSMSACSDKIELPQYSDNTSSTGNSSSPVVSNPNDSNSKSSSTSDSSSSSSGSKPEEPNKPAAVKVDWSTVPVVDEMDLDYAVVEAGKAGDEFTNWLTDEGTEMLKDGCVIITKYFGDAEYINLPENIEGQSTVFISSDVNWGDGAKAIRFPENYTTAFSSVYEMADNGGYSGYYNVGIGSAANVTTVDIPDSWRYIGGFSSFPKLEEIKLPSETRRINKEAFLGCKALKKIDIPENVEFISQLAFQYCTDLEQVNFPQKFENGCLIGNNAFCNCASLKSIDLPEGVSITWKETDWRGQETTSYSKSLFSGCKSLEKAVLPASVDVIGNEMFNGCTALKEVRLASGTKTIMAYAFKSCTSLKTIDIPDSVTKIESGAFSGCADIAINYKGKTYNEKNIEKLYDKDLSTM